MPTSNSEPSRDTSPNQPRRRRRAILLWLLAGLVIAAGLIALLFTICVNPRRY
jgi:LPS O-antigen subunit length determinant protein (WzzB/FepE family)